MTEPVLSGVGAELRRARQAAGLAVADVAQQLKLLPRQIESLEHERFDRLPGPTIARAMVRNYAQLLKLDPEPLLKRMAPGVEKAPERHRAAARPREPMAPVGAGRRSTLLYVASSVVLLALVAVVAYEGRRENAAPQSATALEPQRSAPGPASEPKPAETPVEQPVEKPGEKPVEKPAEPAAQKPAASEPPAAAPQARRLVLRMEEEAWLEVRDGAGRTLVSSLQAAGSERALRGQPPFQLVIGNASHVELAYDGEPVDLKPHMRGEVARFTLK